MKYGRDKEGRAMSDTLTDKDIKELASLGKSIKLGLGCNANGHGIPCRTDRFAVVKAIKRYLEIHDIMTVDI